MKKLIIFYFLIINCFCFAQENLSKKLFNDFDRIAWDFFKDQLNEYIYTDDGFTKNIYHYSYNNKGPYYELILTKDDKDEKYIALLPDNEEFFLVYANDSNQPIHNSFFSKNALLYITDCIYKASSCLKENNSEYNAGNLGNTDLYKPWVEGKKGSGIGEKIEIFSSKNISSLVISNGFVSRNLATYYNNNRVKKLKISDKQNPKNFMEIVLPDNAIPFEYKLNFCSKQLQLEILEIYKGSKYDDTCINFILCK